MKHQIISLLSTPMTKITVLLSNNLLDNLFPLLQITSHPLSNLKLFSVWQEPLLSLERTRSTLMYLFFMVMQMMERNEKDSDYALSQNSAKVLYCTLVNRIKLITLEIIARTKLLRSSKPKQILHPQMHIWPLLR